ncbi:clavaminate synthase family protein [Streptomyces durmitorensis]|uniref:TauD/TfdA family dioxygenase n=1 Tax=Streptomyces durmitorensis TaxID=319947 RepID=A0ABY4PPM5_9ACTN|nr:TauD/TfdA family dioxygenase [Streptomyces durmitorensis]UQT55748.1 TauD/TfdA family dioxygenase [Streptomyces durmitorensis]
MHQIQLPEFAAPDTSAALESVVIHDITAEERAEIAALAGTLTGTRHPLIDTPEWPSAAMDASALLPRTLLRALRAFRHDPGPQGALLLRGLPVTDGEQLPPTPGVPNSVERVPTTAAAVIASVMLQLGEVIAFRNEKDGHLVQNVVPVPGHEISQSNAGSVLLELHIENAFHDNRPDYVGLLSLREDPTGDARLCTSSIRQALPLLDASVIQVLAEPRFRTDPPPSFGAQEGAPSMHPILQGDLADPNAVVDFAATHPQDDAAKFAMAALRDAFVATMSAHRLQVGDLAVVDNRVTVHGRTSFTPRYDGNDRWMERVYAHLDNRRSRADRPGGGRVLG